MLVLQVQYCVLGVTNGVEYSKVGTSSVHWSTRRILPR